MTKEQRYALAGIVTLTLAEHLYIRKKLKRLRHAQLLQIEVNKWTQETLAAIDEYIDATEQEDVDEVFEEIVEEEFGDDAI